MKVNNSVISFVKGTAASVVVNDLASDWATLRDDFFIGRLKNRPNAAIASSMAANNRSRIQKLP